MRKRANTSKQKVITYNPATQGQIDQIMRVGSDAMKKTLTDFGLDKVGAQRIHTRGDKLKRAIQIAVSKTIKQLVQSGKYAKEEEDSSYGYVSGYIPGKKTISEQVEILKDYFPQLHSVQMEIADRELPQHAEGWFAIPRWEKIASTYGVACKRMFEAIDKSRPDIRFGNEYEAESLGPHQIRLSERTLDATQKIAEEQNENDILIIPAQFGILHRGRSVRRSREIYYAHEFGLDVVAVGAMLLVHPERLRHKDDLWVDCAGTEFEEPITETEFQCVSNFHWNDWPDEAIYFSTSRDDDFNDFCGSASGFLPTAVY